MTGPTAARPLRVAVLGGGSWGTALAIHCTRRGKATRLWARSREHRDAMARERRNPRYLSTHRFPDDLEISDLPEAVRDADLIVVSVPSQGLRGVLEELARHLPREPGREPSLLLAAKGVEVETLATMDAVAREALPAAYAPRIATLGGPSFAEEVAQGLPTAVVVACRDVVVAASIQDVLSGAGMRAYTTDDVVGVEIGGAFKNVIAVAVGICDGAGFGANARAALITRGLAELSRLALQLGAHPATLAGLAGVGDLVLTCTGGLSRNRKVGLALGAGRHLDEILAEMGMVAEGVVNTRSGLLLARRERVDMPIVETTHAVLYEGLGVQAAVATLMGRTLKPERE